jgi:hypothetical protein
LRRNNNSFRYHINAAHPSITVLRGYLSDVIPQLILSLIVKRRRVLRLLVFLKTERMLHLVAQTLALGRVAVTTIFLLVDVTAAAALPSLLVIYFAKKGATYAGMEVLLRRAERLLRDEFRRATRAAFRSDQGRFGNVSSTTALGKS